MATLDLVGSSARFQTLLQEINMVGQANCAVLVQGETGTGKELVAKAIHEASVRRQNRFIAVNCAAIPGALLESELFGHERGAFTGAVAQTTGRFQAADRGTLFLDEIGELPLELQPKLLRVLQEQEFERLGGGRTVQVDVRVIAATNQDLWRMVNERKFRADLYYRLSVFPITLPPLRERPDDIPLLLEHFIELYARKAGKNIRHISKDTLERFQAYRWPGNVRELQNVVERAVIVNTTETFCVDEQWLRSGLEPAPAPRNGLLALADREVEMIEAALLESHGRVSGPFGAAAKLGIPRQTLESKMRRWGISKYQLKAQFVAQMPMPQAQAAGA